MPDNNGKEQKKKAKKVWSKPKLVTGKEIGFFGLGKIQATGYSGTPSGSWQNYDLIVSFDTNLIIKGWSFPINPL